MNVYLIEGPYVGKGNRKYVICEVNGRRRKINYAKFALLKEGVDVKDYQEVHHKNLNKHDDRPSNLEPLRHFEHKIKDKRSKKK